MMGAMSEGVVRSFWLNDSAGMTRPSGNVSLGHLADMSYTGRVGVDSLESLNTKKCGIQNDGTMVPSVFSTSSLVSSWALPSSMKVSMYST